MRLAWLLLLVALLAGCGLVGFYRNETAGISPAELVPLYFQEKQYVTDRELVHEKGVRPLFPQSRLTFRFSEKGV